MKRFFSVLKPSTWCLLTGLALAAGGVRAQDPNFSRLAGSWTANSNTTLSAIGNYYRPRGLVTATATATAVGGQVTSFTITNPGAGYTAPPVVTLTGGGGGSGASVVAVLTATGSVASITILQGGSGYTSNPTVTLSAPLLGGVGTTGIFNTDITVNPRLLTVDGNYTYGRMILGDLSGGEPYSFELGTGGRFTFDNGVYAGGYAFLNKFQGGADLIKTPLTINSNLIARVQSNRITVSNTISGPGRLTSTGNGVLAITGDNTGTGMDLVLWNRGGTGTGAQVELGATTGHAVSGNITIGNTTRGTNGHAVLQLLQGRTNLDQINDGSTLLFDSINGVGRNAYFKLMGGSETVGRILDIGDRAIIENREGESVGTSAILTIGSNTTAGNLNSRINGFVRDASGSNVQQGDTNALTGAGPSSQLGITKQGTGDLRLIGGNIIYSGNTLISSGSLTLQNTTNFRSNITNNAQLNFDVTTGTLNMRKVFPTIPNSNPAQTYADEYLSVSGTGSIRKTGAGVLGLFGTQTIGGSFSMDNGTVNLNASATGMSIGGALTAKGDPGLNRNLNLSGVINIGGGIDFTGRFVNTGSSITIAGSPLGRGDQEAAVWVNTAVNVTGSIHINHANLILESDFSIGKTTTNGTSNSNTVVITNSADVVVGMRVSGNGVPANTTITAINPVTRAITLSNNASIPASTALTFRFSNNIDGRITGTPTNITLSGRPNLVGAGDSGSRLVLSNTEFSNNTNRIPDTTPIVSNGGVMEFINNASTVAGANFSETVGSLVLNPGAFQVIGYRAAASRTSTLTFASLQRNAGSILEFGGRDLSSGAAVLDTNNLGVDTRNRILFTTAPTLSNGIIGGWAFANNEWVTYGANGVTRLTTYNTSANTEWKGVANVKMAAGQTFTAAGERLVNSLNIQPDLTLGAAGLTLNINASPLYIASGGLLASHGNHTISSGSTAFLTAGTSAPGEREFFAIVGNTANSTGVNILTVNTSIRDYVISRNISLATSGSTTITLVNGFSTDGLSVGMAVNGSGIVPGTTITAISGNLITLSQPTNAQMGANTAVTFGDSQRVSLVKGGAGTLRLNSDLNAFTGRTVVTNGTLMLGGVGTLGPAPASFVADQVRLDGGFLQFARRTDGNFDLNKDLTSGLVPDKVFDFTDGTRGFTIGSSGGRFEVGVNNPNNAPAGATGEPQVLVNITNPIHAVGLLELAVRATPGLGQFNVLTLGNGGSTNSYLGGLKTEGSFEGIVRVHGNNTIGGLLVEGGQFFMTGQNNFTSDIRVTAGTLTISGANTYQGGQTFPTINMPSGTLRLDHPAALGTGGLSLALGADGEVQLRGIDQTIREISSSATSSARITNTAATPATVTFNLDYNQTFSGQINNAGSGVLNLTKTGPGRLLLTNSQSGFSGTVRIQEGIIEVRTMANNGSPSSFGTGGNGSASQLVLAGGVLAFNPTVPLNTNRSFTLGAGPEAGTLMANGTLRAASAVIGAATSQAIGFEGSGPRTLTLGGVNAGLNTLALQLGDAAPGDPTALMKIGSGVWLLGAASNYSGQTTLVDGVLQINANYSAGTTSIPTTASAAANTLAGNLPNGVVVTLPEFKGSTLPGGLLPGQRYYVVGSDGFNRGAGAAAVVNAVVVQADGKVIIGGNFTSYNGTTVNRIARLTSDGILDPGFVVPGTGANAAVNAVAVQSDGKVLIGGNFTTYNAVTRNRIARLNSDGSLDTNFVVPGTGANAVVNAIHVQADGKVIIAGDFTTYNGVASARIARLNSDGSLDNAFNPGLGADAVVSAMAVQSDGKIIIAGNFTTYNGVTRNRVARLNSDGTLDVDFVVPGTGANLAVQAVAIHSDGKVVIGGNFTTYNGVTRNRIARLNSDGSLDTGFVVPGTGANLIVNSVLIQSDGKVVIGGNFTTYNAVTRNRIARLNGDGSLDSTYANGLGANAVVNALAHQGGGKVILGGDFTSYNGLSRNRIARLETDGSKMDDTGSFQLAATPGGPAIDLTTDGVNVSYVPNIQGVSATTANATNDTFTGNLANGTPVSFTTRAVWDPAIGGGLQSPGLPLASGGNIVNNATYYVVNSNGSTFQIARTPGGAVIDITTTGVNLVYSAAVAGNTSEGIFVLGGRLDIGNVDYTAPETIIFQGGGLGVPRGLQATWAGNVDMQTNANWTINAGSTLTLTGNILGNRTITQLGEGTVVLKGEAINFTAPDAVTNTMDNNRRSYTLQAGTLVLDYSANNNSKLTDNATLVMGGGRRGGVLRLDGGTHKEIVANLSLQAGASRVYRDSGSAVVRFNAISRQTGASIYFDQERIAEVDNANLNGILGGWAIIRDARQDAFVVIPGTVSRSFTADPATATLTTPLNEQVHFLISGVPVRFTTTGELPSGLVAGTTYYVIDATARSFRVSATPFGDAVQIATVGSGVHTVETFGAQRRPGPASLVFTADPRGRAGAAGNNAIRVRILHNAGNFGPITFNFSGSGTTLLPWSFTINTTGAASSASEIADALSTYANAIGRLKVLSSGFDTSPDSNVYPAAPASWLNLDGGADDTGRQALSWARNGSTVPGSFADGLVETANDFQTNVWSSGFNTDVISSGSPINIAAGAATYTLRFANALASTLNLQGTLGHTLQTGAILVSPTVGRNDSILAGTSTLTTGNEGFLQNFLIHQYNELGDLVLGVPLVDRQQISRSGYLSAANTAGSVQIRRITGLVGLDGTGDTSQLSVGMTVTGTGAPGGATIVAIPDNRTVIISVDFTSGDNTRNLYTFDGIIQMTGSIRQVGQNRITGVVNAQGQLATSDLYIGMPINGPGIPPGYRVQSIVNDSDITIGTLNGNGITVDTNNHAYNGMATQMTFSPVTGIEKLGPGTLVVSGNSTYTGITYLGDGTLRANKLTDGGVPGSLGASTNAVANLTFNGGVLQYIGPTSSSNRGLTLFDYAEVNIGHELTTSVFSGSITGADIFAKSGSGTLEMRGNAGLAEIRVLEGRLRVQGTDLNNAPATFTLNNFGQTGLGELRLSGGAFELRGTQNGDTNLTLGGQLYVDAGASEVRAVGVNGINPNNLNAGNVSRTTQLSLMGAEDFTAVQRNVAGTVLFIEEPLVGGSVANILLNILADDRGRILPWAVYQDTTNLAQPGVNNFAAVSQTTGAVVSADSQSQYDIGSFYMNANNWGTGGESPGSINASEGGKLEVTLNFGVDSTAGSNVLLVSEFLSFQFNNLVPDMFVYGPGLPSNTKIVALQTSPLRVVLSKNATTSNNGASYTFIRDRAYAGTLTANRSLNTLRYFSPVDSQINVPSGNTLQLLSGSILVATNVRGGNKSIVGDGSISGAVGSPDGSDLIIHNYNPVAPFTLGTRVTDNVLSIVNSGSISSGSTLLNVLPNGVPVLVRLRVGMRVSGPGIQPGTTIVSIDDRNSRVVISAPSISTQTAQTFSFTDATSFVQTGTGTTVLAGNNDFTGTTYVHGGVLRLNSANAVPGGIGALGGTSNIVVKGGVVGLGHGDFSRAGGSGVAQIDFQGSGGFAAYGADRNVNIGGKVVPDILRYGNNGFVPDGSSFLLGAGDATHKTIVLNPIDLGSFSQAVRVIDGPAATEGELAGGLIGLGKLIKFGTGSLRLSGSSTHTGGIEVAAGRLVVANVPNALGLGAGPIVLGTDLTHTAKNAAIEMVIEGGTITKNLQVGSVNSRGADWIVRGSVDSSGSLVGSQASTALINNHPAIAYYDATAGDLKYVRAADPRGTAWLPPVTVASRGDVGQNPSLSIVNGNPAISYYDATNKLLMFVRSTDVSGVFWSNPVVVDSSPVSAIAVQADGRAIIGGVFVEFDGQVRQRLARINTDGSLDATFAPLFNGEVTALAVQSDDKILVAGAFTEVNGTGRNRLARLNADGSLDTGYNPNLNNTARGLLIEPDGRVVVWGTFTSVGGSGRNRVARINTNGTVDSFNANANNEVRAVARESDGSLILGGTFTQVGGVDRNRIARVSSTGVLDGAFNPNLNNTVSALLIQPDGRIFVGGTFTTLNNGGRRRDRLARLNTNGTPDESFFLDADAEVRGFLRQLDGKILVHGAFTRIGITPRFNLARLNTDDTLDTGFNPDANDEVLSVAQVTGGQLLVGGSFSNIGGGTRHFLARLTLDGQGDLTFNRQTLDRGRFSSLAQVRQAAAFNAGEERPAIAYYDVAGGLLRFTRAVDVNGANWNPPLILDAAANVGTAISLAMVNIGGDVVTKNNNGTPNNPNDDTATISGIAINGTPAVAYYDVTNADLKYVLSNDPAGTDWSNPVTVHSSGDVGSHLSLALVDGRPAIAYHDATTPGLRYVRATSPGGITSNLRDINGNILTRAVSALIFTGNWGAPVLVEGGQVGTFASLAIITDSTSAQGRPAIAYYDGAGLNLKYVRAQNTTGSSWGTPRTVVSMGDVGRSAGLVLTDGVPGIAYHDATAGDLKFLHLADATGYSRITLNDGTDWQGGVNIDGDVFFNVGADAVATVSGLIEGAAGIKVSGLGTLRLTNGSNSFGATLPGPAASINSAVIVRSGTLALGANGAVGTATIELGDALPQILTVDRATTFQSLTAVAGRFDADHNGFFDNAGGPGAFVDVDTTIDGFTYSPEGMTSQPVFILVKDERDNPQWNGVYQIIFNSDLQPDGTMNLVRVAAMDTAAELAYGTQVRVTNGTHAGRSFFIASQVDELNASAVNWVRDVADTSAALLAEVAGLNISNAIDINGNPLSIGDGSRAVLGGMATLTSGNVQFSGSVLLQNRRTGVREERNLDLQSFTSTGYGVSFTGLFAESDSGTGSTQDLLRLRKTGSGVATLTAANTFRGGVTVNEGTLLAMNSAGSATGLGSVVVNAGAVLGGTGFIGGPVSLAGTTGIQAILRPGDPTVTAAIETLTLSSTLTVGADSVVEFAAGAASLTRLVANSVAVTGTGRFLLTLLDGYTPAVDTVIDLVDGTISLPAGANLRNHLVLPGNLRWDTSSFLSDGTLRVLGATVPVAIATPPAITTPVSGGPVNPGGNVTVTFTATVSGSADFRYQWQKSPVGMNSWTNVGAPFFSTSTTATLTLTGVFEADEADYRLVAANGSLLVEDANTFTATSVPVTLVVNDPPTITQQPAPVTVNPGETAVLSVTATGPGPIFYQWRRGTTNLTAPTEGLSTFQIPNVQKAQQGTNYNVLVSNAASAVSGPTQSVFFSLTVRDPVVVTNFPASTGVAEGDAIVLNLGHSGSGTPDLPEPGAPAFTYVWERDNGAGFAPVPGAPNAAQLVLPAATPADHGAVIRVTVSNSFSTAQALTTIAVVNPSVRTQPDSRTVLAGSALTLSVEAGGSEEGRVFQWKRGKSNLKEGGGITGVNTPNLQFANIDLKLAGDYSCEIRNAFGVRLSDPAFITVVGAPGSVVPVQTGKSATFTLPFAAPKGVTVLLKWQKDGVDLPADLRYSADNLAKFTIARTTADDSGIYTCRVTSRGPAPAFTESVNGGAFDLRVFSEGPVLALEAFPPAMVGAWFDYQIQVDPDPARAPTVYSAKPLPVGLKLDARTGRITGIPKAPVENMQVVLGAGNVYAKLVTQTLPLTVQAVPTQAVGVFAGWIPRHAQVNSFMGGRIDFTVAGTGALSGRLILGPTTYAFKGLLELDPTGVNLPEVNVSIPRKGKPLPPPIALSFRINTSLNRLESGTVEVDGEEVQFGTTTWRNPWNALTNPAVTALEGYHTLALLPPGHPNPAAELPQGSGYAAFTATADGRLTLAGRTADGQTIANAAFLGPNGQIVFFQPLYRSLPRGSLLGNLSLNRNLASELSDNHVSGALTWNCPPNPVKNFLYPEGFGNAGDDPIVVTAVGGHYAPPEIASEANPTPNVLFGLAPGNDNAMLSFLNGGVEDSDTNPNLDGLLTDAFPPDRGWVSILAGSRPVVPKGTGANPGTTTLKLAARTGLFSGSFALQDVNSATSKVERRTTPFFGIVIDEDGGALSAAQVGAGYFLLRAHPNFLPAEPPLTLKTTPIRSGEVIFEARPAPNP